MADHERTTRVAVGFFVVMLVASLGSAFLGGIFGSLVATISPEAIADWFAQPPGTPAMHYAIVVGMVFGLFIGACVSGFACLLAVAMKILRLHIEHRGEGSSVSAAPEKRS